jgi:hypothetical protein
MMRRSTPQRKDPTALPALHARADHALREAAVVESQPTELFAMDGGFDGRPDVV